MTDEIPILLVCEHCHYTVTRGERVVVGTKGVIHLRESPQDHG